MYLFCNKKKMVGLKVGTITWENCLQVSNKAKHVCALIPYNSFLWSITEMSGNCPSRDMYKTVHRYFFHKIQSYIKHKCLSRVKETNCGHIHSISLHSNKKEWTALYITHVNHICMLSQKSQFQRAHTRCIHLYEVQNRQN